MMSRQHSLPSSASQDKPLASVQALHPYLHESLKRSGCEIFQNTNGHDVYIQGHEQQYGDGQDSCLRSQDLGDFRIKKHDMSYAQRQPQMYILEQDLEGNECILGHNYVVSAQNGSICVHDEGHGHDGYEPNGYIHHDYQVYGHDGYWLNGYIPHDYINDQAYGQIQHGHEDQYRSLSIPTSSLAHMAVSRADTVPDILLLYDTPSSTLKRFCSHDDWSLPSTEEALQLPLPLHSPYLFTQHDTDHYHPQAQDHEMEPASIGDVALDTGARRLDLYDNAIDKFVSMPVTPLLSSPCNEEKVSKTACAKVSSLPGLHRQKMKPNAPTNSENSSDESDALEDEGGHNHCNPHDKVMGISSNLVSERRRRQKINDALYTLRSVVPIVSKMDKTSIVSDALMYAKQLQKQVDDMQNDIRTRRVGKIEVARVENENVQEESSDISIRCKVIDVDNYCQSLPKHKLLELTVSSIERNTYNVQMRCKKGRGDLLQLARAVEALDLDMLNASVSSVGDLSIINTVVVKVDPLEELKPEKLKEMMLKVGSKYGLHV